MGDPVILNIKFVRPDGLVAAVMVESARTITLGRDLACDVRLDGRKVSRRHFRLENRGNGDVFLVDQDSHNGTYVNGQRVNEVPLTEGDLVQAGEWEGRVELKASRASGPVRPPGMPMMMAAVNVGGARGATMTPSASAPTPMPSRDITATNRAQASGTASASATGGLSVAAVSAANAGAAQPGAPRGGGHPPGHPGNTGENFDGVTDPEAQRQPRGNAGMPPPKVTQVTQMTPNPVTRVMAVADFAKSFNWEEGNPSTDALRSARVEDNPIVRRFSESQVNLDFRGLTELSQGLQESSTGIRPTSPQAIDGIALRLVFKVTEALAQADSMDHFLQEMCESLQTAARAKGVIVLLPDDTGGLVPRVVKLRRPDEKVQLSKTVIEHAVSSMSALTTEDASADERFARGESVLRFDLKAVLCVPLVKENAVVGALYLTRDLPFSNTERDLVAALGQLIAMGLERSRLREQYAAAERTKRSLERFHAPDVVRRLMMETNAPVSARGDGLFLEPLTCTVLFCDLAGFTKWCESHDAETVGKVLNMYLGEMTERVFKYGGTVDKFIGDAIMCIFGAPFMSPDDPIRAVKCAVEMRSSFRDLIKSGKCGDEAKNLDVHIGVNTGKVVAGTVGSPQRMEYTALGDTVNIASRLEGVAKAGMIVIGPATAALVRDQINLKSLGPVSLKGKSDQIEAFEVPDDTKTQ